MLTKEESLVKAIKAIHAMGPSKIVIKKGEHGALGFYEGEISSFPAFPPAFPACRQYQYTAQKHAHHQENLKVAVMDTL